eukprot:Pgem_evm1s14157
MLLVPLISRGLAFLTYSIKFRQKVIEREQVRETTKHHVINVNVTQLINLIERKLIKAAKLELN